MWFLIEKSCWPTEHPSSQTKNLEEDKDWLKFIFLGCNSLNVY